jgi:segregation and condensation protein B
MFGTTKAFLDYFGLKKLDDLPPLADLSDWENLRVQLDLPDVDDSPSSDADVPPDVPALFAEAVIDTGDSEKDKDATVGSA